MEISEKDRFVEYFERTVIPILADQLGYAPGEILEALEWRFLQKEGSLPTVRSTADLSTAEFTEYIERCRRLAADMGVSIPSPGFAE